MGMYLIGEGWGEWLMDLGNWQAMLMVALGLGMVIFVHELGHFAVAKMCGVKCEKFYLGFDIYGLKLLHFRWGETEYGIGILPLGGYVKMLGQDDNPAKMREEKERAKVKSPVKAEMHGDMPVSVETDHPVAYDPRSYMAKSVPQRMAIISAGVIMNLIFAVVFAAIAYAMGVKEVPCVVSRVVPGGAAWIAGMQPGDRIIKLGNLEKPWFSDIQRVVPIGDAGTTYPCTVLRDGKEVQLTLRPQADASGITLLGVVFSESNQLLDTNGSSKHKSPTEPGSPAAKTESQFASNDLIVGLNGQPVTDGYQIAQELSRHLSEPIEYTVQRTITDNKQSVSKTLAIQVGPKPMRLVGLALSVSSITAVRSDSPAEKAGIEVGDQLDEIDGQPIGDPTTLGQALREQVGKTIKLTLTRKRDGKPEKISKDVTLVESPSLEESAPRGYNSAVSVPQIGIAFHVLDAVTGVEAGSPADKAGMKVGDVISAVAIIKPKAEKSDEKSAAADQKAADADPKSEDYDDTGLDSEPYHLDAGRANWPVVIYSLQHLSKQVRLKLTIGKGKDAHDIELEPAASNKFFSNDRGLVQQSNFEIRQAHSVGEGLSLAFRKTGESLYMVVGFLKKLLGGGISPKLMGGPLAIGGQAFHFAHEGVPAFLLFLTMVSANLAVINFLPIPVLDGGHMVFLAYEGIRRKPVTEQVVNALSLVGFAMLVCLMIFVFSLDLGLVARFSNR